MEDKASTFKKKAMLIGGVGGAVVGLLAAIIFVKAAEDEADANDGEIVLSPAKGLQIGMLVIGLLRQLSSL